MSLYEDLGVATIINAKGPATRLSGGILRREVAAAMVEASQACIHIVDLQAAASREIARATGAEAGYVASGASACLLLATAAAITGCDPGRMARLPDTRGMKNEVVMVRSQRNFYDHAVRAAGATIIEVGLPDRYAGAGVRDAEAWEIDEAIGERTAAVFYVADPMARPLLPEVVGVAHRRGVPVIVDAAAQLPPTANLRRFIGDGADLVAFSGGKALGGPQASGILAGRRDLVMAAALQHQDLDIHWDLWEPPAGLIDKAALRGAPAHGLGRSCKAGKEEIAGLLVALKLFIAEGDAKRHAGWLADVERIAAGVAGLNDVAAEIVNASVVDAVPRLVLRLDRGRHDALAVTLALQHARPAVIVELEDRHGDTIVCNPLCLGSGEAATVGATLRAVLSVR